MKLWHLITRNADGTPLFGAVWAGPLLIGIALVKIVADCFF